MKFFAPDLKIGLDIGASSIKLVALHRKSNKIYSLKNNSMLGEDKAQEPDDINDFILGNAISEVLTGLPLNNSTINISLSVNYNNLFVINIPAVSDEEIKQTVYWDLGSLLPDNIDDYEYDFRILDRDKKSKAITLLVGAIPKQKIETVLSSIEKFSVNIPSIDLDVLFALDLFKNEIKRNTDALGLLQMGARHCTYSIISKDHSPAFLVLPFGGNTLDKLIGRHKNYSFLSASNLRMNDANYHHSEAADGDDSSIEKIVMESIVDFTRSLIQFNARYEARNGIKVGEVFATGGLLNDALVYEALANSNFFLGIPCHFWDPLKSIKSEQQEENFEKYTYAAAVGAALRE